jgi:L-alanine-DL-glutamate epimerase-like enolase superfamily enzyme
MISTVAGRAEAAVTALRASAYTIPADSRESDGTFEWDSTTLVLVELEAEGERGLGWTYGAAAAARLAEDLLAPVVSGRSVLDIGAAHGAMRAALRNVGRPGVGATALSAVDVAFWDLKAKLLGLPLVSLLGAAHESVPVYGSGGFCSYSDARLAQQLAGWVEEGIPRVKMKIGRGRDVERVRLAREAIGRDAELYVDANGAYAPKQALGLASAFAELGVTWFEEPVSSRNVEGLRLVRGSAPPAMEVAAGEYAWEPADFRDLTGAVDCLQADATRCGGITGLLAAAALAEANELDLSGHTAPTIHTHALTAVPRLRHLEWFHDHVLVERRLFDGFIEPVAGVVRADLSRPGLGVEFKHADAAAAAVR